MNPELSPLRAEGLTPSERARGRRLAITSHPAGMAFRTVFGEDLPTLALVSLGASETLLGLQRAFIPLGQLLQLPTLRAVGRFPMRSILVFGQGVAVAGSLPLAFYGAMTGLGAGAATALVLACLAVTALGLTISGTVWFPLLRGYTEPEAVGRFFGALRTGWHLTLILYFAAAQAWLTSRPGDLGPLFAVGCLAGVVRIALVARLPEAPPGARPHIRIREALGLLGDPLLRRYLLGVGLRTLARGASIPFVIVLMRRVIGFSDGQVLLTTVATYTGGLVSLYLWGRIVDRVGAAPVFLATLAGLSLLLLSLLLVREGTPETLGLLVGFFFLTAVLGAGFGVAETHVLFDLAPAASPTSVLVVASVTISLLAGAAPVAVGFLLERSLAAGVPPLETYQGVFLLSALLQLGAYPLLRGFRRSGAGRRRGGRR